MLYPEFLSVVRSQFKSNDMDQEIDCFQLEGVQSTWKIIETYQVHELADAQRNIKICEYQCLFDETYPKTKLFQDSNNSKTVYILLQELSPSANQPKIKFLNEFVKWLDLKPEKELLVSSDDEFNMEDVYSSTHNDEVSSAILESYFQELNEEFYNLSHQQYVNEKLLIFMLLPSDISDSIFHFKDFKKQFPIYVFWQDKLFNDYLLGQSADDAVNQLKNRLEQSMWLNENFDANDVATKIENSFRQYIKLFKLKNYCKQFYDSTIAKYSESFYNLFLNLEIQLMENFDDEAFISRVSETLNYGFSYYQLELKLQSIEKNIDLLCDDGFPLNRLIIFNEAIIELLKKADAIKFHDTFHLLNDTDFSESLTKLKRESIYSTVFNCLMMLDNKLALIINKLDYKKQFEFQSKVLLKNNPLMHSLFFSFVSVDFDSNESLMSTTNNLRSMNEYLSENQTYVTERLNPTIITSHELPYKSSSLIKKEVNLIKKIIEKKSFKLELLLLKEEINQQNKKKKFIENINIKITHIAKTHENISWLLTHSAQYKNIVEKNINDLILYRSKLDRMLDRAKDKFTIKFERLLNEYRKCEIDVNNAGNSQVLQTLMENEFSEEQFNAYFTQSQSIILIKKIQLIVSKLERETDCNSNELKSLLKIKLEAANDDPIKLKNIFYDLSDFLIINLYFKVLSDTTYIRSDYDKVLLNNHNELASFSKFTSLSLATREAYLHVYRDANLMHVRRDDIDKKLLMLETFKINQQDSLLLTFISQSKKLNSSPKTTCSQLVDLQHSLTNLEAVFKSDNYISSIKKIAQLRAEGLNESSKILENKFLVTHPFKRHTLCLKGSSSSVSRNINLFFEVDSSIQIKPLSPTENLRKRVSFS